MVNLVPLLEALFVETVDASEELVADLVAVDDVLMELDLVGTLLEDGTLLEAVLVVDLADEDVSLPVVDDDMGLEILWLVVTIEDVIVSLTELLGLTELDFVTVDEITGVELVRVEKVVAVVFIEVDCDLDEVDAVRLTDLLVALEDDFKLVPVVEECTRVPVVLALVEVVTGAVVDTVETVDLAVVDADVLVEVADDFEVPEVDGILLVLLGTVAVVLTLELVAAVDEVAVLL